MKISQIVFASALGLVIGVSAIPVQAEEKRNEGLPLFLWLTGQTADNSAQANAAVTPAAVPKAAAKTASVASKQRKKSMKSWKSGPKVNTGRKLASTTAIVAPVVSQTINPASNRPAANRPTVNQPTMVASAATAPAAKKLPPVKKPMSRAAKSDAVRGGLAPRNYSLADLFSSTTAQPTNAEEVAAVPSHAPRAQPASASVSPAPVVATPALTEDATVIASVLPLVATQPVAAAKPKARARTDMKTWKSHAKRAAVKKQSTPPGIDPKFARKKVAYESKHPVGSIVVDTSTRYLYHVLPDGHAMRYGIGVGRLGFTWKGTAKIKRKAEWPAWHPPASMRKREPWLPVRMEGGPENPLGARALYLFQGGVDTLYRIHGTNNPASIGQALSSGCVRLLNSDIEHLYTQVKMGSKVVVL